MQQLAAPILDQLGLRLPTRTLVRDLPLAERQLVEIAKALVSQPRVLLLDEPTSALEGRATERLLGIIRVLRDREVAVVFVSHILEEVMSLCDEVTVLRDGDVVAEGDPIAQHKMRSIVAAMIGDRPAGVFDVGPEELPPLSDAGGALQINGISLSSGVRDVSLTVRPGEVVGLTGLEGSGPTEILRAIAGIERPTRAASPCRGPPGATRPARERRRRSGLRFG